MMWVLRAVLVAVSLWPAWPSAAGTGHLRPAERKLSEIQAELDEITEVKRAVYASFAENQGEIEDAQLRVSRALERNDAVELPRGDPDRPTIPSQMREPVWLRQETLRSLLIRARALEVNLELLGEQIQLRLALVRSVMRRAIGVLIGTGSLDAWNELWPQDVREEGALRACPVAGPWSLTDTFGAPRPGGRTHQGNDILAARGTPVAAAHAGVAVRAPNTLGGRAVKVYGPDGDSYYAHLSAYGAVGPVEAGEIIGYVGNSGNARGLVQHLHFEYRSGGGSSIDPFRLVLAVCLRPTSLS